MRFWGIGLFLVGFMDQSPKNASSFLRSQNRVTNFFTLAWYADKRKHVAMWPLAAKKFLGLRKYLC